MYISKTVTTDVDVCIEVDPEDVLDEMSLEEIQKDSSRTYLRI